MSDCAICGDTGFEPVRTASGVAVRPCPCRIAKRHDVPGLPDWCRGLRLDSLRSGTNAGIYLAAREWLDDATTPRPDLYLYGPTGVGKTTLAAALLGELARGGVRTWFVGVATFLRLQVDAVALGDLKADARKFYQRAATVGALTLDDVGANEKSSDFSRGILTTLLDTRLAASLTTIWTSNLSIADLAGFYDDRLASRIVGACRGNVFEFGGVDLRLDSRRH